MLQDESDLIQTISDIDSTQSPTLVFPRHPWNVLRNRPPVRIGIVPNSQRAALPTRRASLDMSGGEKS
jgi:hypothetical protein